MCCASTTVPPDVAHWFGFPKHHPAGGEAVGLRHEEAAHGAARISRVRRL
jgi:hypothetical protein